jgi:ArsR family transcriptional regulator
VYYRIYEYTNTEGQVAQDGCCTAPDHGLETEAIEHDVRVASAVGNENRYGLLRSLVAADGEVCACEFVETLGASQSTVSRGLSELYDAGLVTRRKEGQWRYYAPTEAAGRLIETFDSIREGR